MRTGLAFGLMLAGAMFFGGMALADGPWESYGEHMSKYHKHMAEAAEEAADGDWDDYYEELGKANQHYNAAQFHRRLAEPVFVTPRYETRTYYYGPTYTRGYYRPGYTSDVTIYRYQSYGW